MTPPAALALAGISKRFGATDALLDASLDVRPGTIHALLGENGAGKTTLMRIAYGLVQPDRGTIRTGTGNPVRLTSPADAIRVGIGMVHQHFTVVHAMSVAENVALGGRGRFDRRATGMRVREIAASIGVSIDPDARAGTLGVPAQQQLEIIKSLSRDARVLILDEPTSVLAPVEVEQLMAKLRALAATGLGIVLITHKLREALAIADDVTVLHRGATVLTASAASLTEGALAAAMVGAGWSDEAREAEGNVRTPRNMGEGARSAVSTTAAAPPVVRARGISVHTDREIPGVRDVDLDVHGGEIVGIAGVEGSGIRELLRALARRTTIAAGTLETADAIGFIPEDRHLEAIALDMSVMENAALRGTGARRGLSRWGTRRDQTRALLGEFDIRAPGPDTPVRMLSGGNQQKLVLARELQGPPSLLIAENPTRGLDLRATAAIHARLRDARDAGMAIVVYSSDLDELLLLADRTYAMFGGRLIPTARDRRALGQAMLGTAARQ